MRTHTLCLYKAVDSRDSLLSFISCILHTSAIFYFSPFTRTHTYACARLLAPKFLRSIKTPSHCLEFESQGRSRARTRHALNPRFPSFFVVPARPREREDSTVRPRVFQSNEMSGSSRPLSPMVSHLVPVRTRLFFIYSINFGCQLRMSSTCQSIFAGSASLRFFLSYRLI